MRKYNDIIKKYSFDFDNTLLDPDDSMHSSMIQEMARAFVLAGHDVWILTSRAGLPVQNYDLYEIARKIGIPRENVIFAYMKSKALFVKEYNFDAHFDDDIEDIFNINLENEHKPGILVGFKSKFHMERFKE